MANVNQKNKVTMQGTGAKMTTELFTKKIAEGEYIIELGNNETTFVRYILLKVRHGHELWTVTRIPHNKCGGISYHIGATNYTGENVPYHATEYIRPKEIEDEMILCWNQLDSVDSAHALQEAMEYVTSFEFYD